MLNRRRIGRRFFKSSFKAEAAAIQCLVLILGFSTIARSAPSDPKVPCRITKDDLTIYATILRDSRIWKPQVDPDAVNGYTLTAKGDDWDSPLGPLGKRGSGLMANASKETVNDFVSKRTKSCFIGSLKKRDLVRGPDSDVVTADGKSNNSRPKYWEGFIRLSRIGFNSARDEALVYTETGCGALCGSGDLFFLKRKGSDWRIVEHLNLWLS